MTAFTLNYDLTGSDLTQGTILQMRLMRRFLIFAALFVVMTLGVDAYFILLKGFRHRDLLGHLISNIELAIGVSLVVVVGIRFVAVPWGCRKRLRENPYFFRGLRMEADERGILFESEKSRTQWQWGDLLGFREDKNVFLICSSRSIAHVVPKRLLSDEDARNFRQLIEGKLRRLA